MFVNPCCGFILGDDVCTSPNLISAFSFEDMRYISVVKIHKECEVYFFSSFDLSSDIRNQLY